MRSVNPLDVEMLVSKIVAGHNINIAKNYRKKIKLQRPNKFY